MEFSFKVTESEFREAWRVERKASSRASLKTAVFWISIMLGLLVLYRVMQPKPSQARDASVAAVTQTSLILPAGQVPTKPSGLERVGPFLVLAGLWILIVKALVPMRLKYLYRKDPRMQGQFTVNVTPDSMTTDNSAGTTAKTNWNVYDYWSEGKNVIVLMFHSGSYAILSLAGLSPLERGELRDILGSALPRR